MEPTCICGAAPLVEWDGGEPFCVRCASEDEGTFGDIPEPYRETILSERGDAK